MQEYTTHCTECGSLLLEDEIAYSESGSLVSPQIELCEYCAHIHGHDDMDADFDDFETFLNEFGDEFGYNGDD